jgi:dGTPase
VSEPTLAPWACDPLRSRGRRIPESLPPPRTEHQRDRDRVVHSNAFRRLVYKTQVFINHEGDLFRTRLTHSLEVAQLGRSAARALRLNEDLVEAIALAHDLGHTPFGHAGQDALDDCMRDHGGFEHNLQSLRVVDQLEARYPAFDGLNLTLETREGILKHCSRSHALLLESVEPDGPAARFLDGRQASLEAQLVNLADELAYTSHDIDDGVRSGLITLEQLGEVPVFARWRQAVCDEYPALADRPGRRLLFETLRRMLSWQLGDLIESSQLALAARAPADAQAARTGSPLIRFSTALVEELIVLKRFLFRELYRHPQVVQSNERARAAVSELFAAYRNNADELPAEYRGQVDRPRAMADYIAGMTDRYALKEHHRLTGRRLFG